MRSRTILLAVSISLILGASAPRGLADCDPVGIWTGTLLSNAGDSGTLENFIFYVDGNTTGSWTSTINGVIIESNDGSGNYSFSDCILNATYEDMAEELKDHTTSFYTLSLKSSGDMSDCDVVEGDYQVAFSDANWSSRGLDWAEGTWRAERTTAPSKAVDPIPLDGATTESTTVELSWSNGGGACSYDVYFDGQFKGNQQDRTYNPGPLVPESMHIWRVDSVNTNGPSRGDEWTFTTLWTTDAPSIAASIDSHNFAMTGVSKEFEIWNDGTGTLNYDVSVTAGAAYFSVSPPSGSSTGAADRNIHTIIVDRNNLLPDSTVTGTVTISSAQADDSPKYITLSAQTAGDLPCTWTGVLDGEECGTWAGTLLSDTGDSGILENWTFYADGSTTGSWTSAANGVFIRSDDASGTYTFSDCLLSATYVGVAEESAYHTTSSYTMSLTSSGDMPDWDVLEGEYDIVFDNPDWHSYGLTSVAGTWSANRTTAPSKAVGPIPPDGATTESTTVDLSWSNGGGACSYDVYVDGQFKGNQRDTTYDPGPLAPETTHTWRVDSVNSSGATQGDEWTFALPTTEVPSIAADIESHNFAMTGVSKEFEIWNDGTGTLNYDVSVIGGAGYFSVSPPGGSSTGDHDRNMHTIIVHRSNLPPEATVTGTVMISSAQADDSPKYITLSARTTGELPCTWSGVLDSEEFGLNGTISNWAVCSDGTTSGHWELDIGGGAVISLDPIGAYSMSGYVLQFSISGTAYESAFGTTSDYVLNVEGVMYNGLATGNYDITLTNPQWMVSNDSGTWRANLRHAEPDINLDGVVNFRDYTALTGRWSESACAAWDETAANVDLNCDGVIDYLDLGVVTDNWLVFPGQGPKLLLHFNGLNRTTSTVDSSGNSHKVDFHGDAYLNVDNRKWGTSSLKLDGDRDCLSIADSPDWDILASNSDSWTIDLWVKHDVAGSSGNYLSHYQDETHWWHLQHRNTPPRGVDFVCRSGATPYTMILGGTKASTFTDTQWHHIAVCKVESNWGLYLDGSQVGYQQVTDEIFLDGPLGIGCENHVGNFDGWIDELRVYKGNPFKAAPHPENSDAITLPTDEY